MTLKDKLREINQILSTKIERDMSLDLSVQIHQITESLLAVNLAGMTQERISKLILEIKDDESQSITWTDNAIGLISVVANEGSGAINQTVMSLLNV